MSVGGRVCAVSRRCSVGEGKRDEGHRVGGFSVFLEV